MSAEEIFWLAVTGLPRGAPGSDATTRLLLRLAGSLPPAAASDRHRGRTGPASGRHLPATRHRLGYYDPLAARIAQLRHERPADSATLDELSARSRCGTRTDPTTAIPATSYAHAE